MVIVLRLWYNKSNTYIIQKSGWGHDKAQINTTENKRYTDL